MTYTQLPYTTRQQWLNLRRQGIGASDIAAITGQSPWTTPHQIWISKLQEVPDSEPTEDMEWGLRMEHLIIEEACYRLNAYVPADTVPPLCRNNERPWMLATPDAIVSDDENSEFIIEAKKVDAWSWDEVPGYYMAQVQWQLAVTGLQHAVIAALHRGRRLELYHVTADKEVQAELVSAGEAFWGLCKTSTPPPVEAGDNAFLSSLWPQHVERAVEIPAELADELRAAKVNMKAAEERLDLVQAQLKGLLEEADTAVVGQEIVATWRTQQAHRLDVKALRAEEPDIADTYTRTSTSRVLRIKEGKQ